MSKVSMSNIFSSSLFHPFSACRVSVGSGANALPEKASISEWIGSLVKLMGPPQRRCMECLCEISRNDERCPRCRALQSSEDNLIRGKDSAWF